jgi:hypothetical protein
MSRAGDAVRLLTRISRFRCDDMGDLTECPECEGRGVIEICQECAEAREDEVL